MKKKIVLTLLTAIMLFSFLAVTALAVAHAPVPAADLSEVNGMIVVSNADVGAKYMLYSAATGGTITGANWTATATTLVLDPATSASWTGSYVGGTTYYIAVSKTTDKLTTSTRTAFTMKSLEVGDPYEKPTGLSLDINGALVGYDSKLTYEWVPATLNKSKGTFSYDEASYKDVVTSTVGTTFFTTPGIYAVRVKSGNDATYTHAASDPCFILVSGDNVGSVSTATSASAAEGKFYLTGERTQFANEGASKRLAYGIPTAMTFDQYKAAYVTYIFPDDELLEAAKTLSFTFQLQSENGDIVSREGGVPGKVTFYVADGEKDSYDFTFNYNYKTRTDIKLNIKEAIPSGIIYKMVIDFVDDNTSFTESDLNFRPAVANYYVCTFFSNRNEDSSRALFDYIGAHAAPVLSTEGTDVEGKYLIKGFNANYKYEYSTNALTYTALPEGITEYIVDAGSYWFRAMADESHTLGKSTKVRIDGAQPATTSLKYEEIDEGTYKITGFKDGYTYEWHQVTLANPSTYNSAQAVITSGEFTNGGVGLTAGLYAFRIRGNAALYKVSGMAQYVYIPGSGAGKLNNSIDKSVKDSFSTGAWTGYNGIYNDNSNDCIQSYAPTTVYSTNKLLSFKYACEGSQIIPAKYVGDFKFNFGFANGCPFNFDEGHGKVRYYIIGGKKEYYDVPFSFTNNGIAKVSLSEVIDSTETGYFAGLEIFYFDEDNYPENLGVSNSTLNYLCLVFPDKDPDKEFILYTAKKIFEMPELKVTKMIPGYGAEIIGLPSDGLYQVRTYNEMNGPEDNWVDIPAGMQTIKVQESPDEQDYEVRAYFPSTHGKYLSSEPVKVTVYPADPEDERRSAKTKLVLEYDDANIDNLDYTFDITGSHWISRLALSNIVEVAKTNDLLEKTTVNIVGNGYKYELTASQIKFNDTAHYYDFGISFDGEKEYDRLYPKMEAIATKLVKGIYFESSTGLPLDNASVSIYLGEEFDGMEVQFRTYNAKANRLKKIESSFVEDGYADFSKLTGSYVILCPEMDDEPVDEE